MITERDAPRQMEFHEPSEKTTVITYDRNETSKSEFEWKFVHNRIESLSLACKKEIFGEDKDAW